MTGVIFRPDCTETRYQLQRKARLEMITKLEADNLADMQVCDFEGWDKMEYIRELQKLINSFGAKENGHD